MLEVSIVDETSRPSQHNQIYRLLHLKQWTLHRHWMGWERRSQKTYQRALRRRQPFRWAHHLGVHEADLQRIEAHAREKDNAPRFEAGEYFHLPGHVLEGGRFGFGSSFRVLNFRSLFKSGHSTLHVTWAHSRLWVQLQCRCLVSWVYLLLTVWTQFPVQK